MANDNVYSNKVIIKNQHGLLHNVKGLLTMNEMKT